MRTVNLSWRQVEELSRKLVKNVRASGFKPQYLVGITVSGLFPVALVAKVFDTKDVAIVSARSYSKRRQGKLKVTALPKVDLRGKRVLLVDEIADRGTTLKHISKILKTHYKVGQLKTAVLVVNKKNCETWPDYYMLTVDKWVVFPWDSRS
ncbi:hypothetical protein C4556_02845 [Candidatus Parcubacteria bacterium]|nr:MAG: hypothetical protein C4556_02845 [Candidatus Parcubacteria bacterium]